MVEMKQVKIVGKYIDGWIFKTPYLCVEVMDVKEGNKYIDIPVNMSRYYAANKEEIWKFEFEQRDDKLWYLV